MGGYVNIKTFDHTLPSGEVKGVEVSVAFKVYSDAHRIAGAHYQIFPSDAHRIAGAHYQIFPSEEPAYADVVETAEDWATKNAAMFVGVPAEPEEPAG